VVCLRAALAVCTCLLTLCVPICAGLTAASLAAVPVPVRMGSLEGTQAVDVLTAHQQQQQRAAAASAPAGGNSSSGASAGKMGWQGLWGSNATPAANFGSNYLLCECVQTAAGQQLMYAATGATKGP
jgi:hypothetical protein